jgi:hypothetical protein
MQLVPLRRGRRVHPHVQDRQPTVCVLQAHHRGAHAAAHVGGGLRGPGDQGGAVHVEFSFYP